MADGRAPETARALFDSVAWLAEHGPGGWSHADADAFLAVTRMIVPTLNGVWLPEGALGDAAVLDARLDRVAAERVPYCLEFPVGDGLARSVAVARGMTREDDIPLMRLDSKPSGTAPDGLVVSRLAPEEAWLHGRIAAEGFGVAEAVLTAFVDPGIANRPEIHYYVGEVDGEPVVTGMGLHVDHALGVWDIGTPPAHRRHGYGAAITSAIVRDGFAAGARWCWLQSSTAGAPVYAALGFETVATWECWVADGSDRG